MRENFSVADPIPDPSFFQPGSQIRIKEFKYFNPKNCENYDPGCSSRIQTPDPDLDFLSNSDPGPRSENGTGSQILIRNTGKPDVLFRGNYLY
jgi:hypothetical protein